MSLHPGRYIAVVMPVKESGGKYPIIIAPFNDGILQIQVCFKLEREEVRDTGMFQDMDRPGKIWWYQALTGTNGKPNQYAMRVLEHKRLFNWDRESFDGLVKEYPSLRCCLTLEPKDRVSPWMKIRFLDPVDNMDRPMKIWDNETARQSLHPDELDMKYGKGILKGGER